MTSSQSIRFCGNCENKLYHTIENDLLSFYCRVCGTTEKIINEGVCVLNIQYDQNKSDKPFEQIVNKYIKHDPTLPHLVLPCPNEKCKTNESATKQSDILYLRYDNINMKHLYMCTECDFTWKTNE